MTTSADIANRALAAIGTRSNISALTDRTNEARACSLHYESTRDQLLAAAGWGFAKRTSGLLLAKAQQSTGLAQLPDFSADDFNPQDFNTGTYGWDGTYPPPQWLYEYLIPDDCLQTLYCIAQPSAASGIPLFSSPTSCEPALVGAVKYSRGSDQIPQIGADGNAGEVDVTVLYCNIPSPLLTYIRRVTNENLWDPWFTEAMTQALASRICLQLSGKSGDAKRLEDAANSLVMKARERDANQNLQVIDQVPDWLTARGVTSYNAEQGYGYGPLFGGLV